MKLRSANWVGSIAFSATLGTLCLASFAGAEPGAPDPEANFVDSGSKSTAPAKPSAGDVTKNVFVYEKILEQLKTGTLPKDMKGLMDMASSLACQVPNWKKGWDAHRKAGNFAQIPPEFQIQAGKDTPNSAALKTLAVSEPKRLQSMAKAKVHADLESFKKSALLEMWLAQLQKEGAERAKHREDVKDGKIDTERSSIFLGGGEFGTGDADGSSKREIERLKAESKTNEPAIAARLKARLEREQERFQKTSFEELVKDPKLAQAWQKLKINPDKTQSGLEDISKSFQRLEAAVEKDPKLAYRVMEVKGQNVLTWMDSRAKDWFQNHQENILNGGAVGSLNEPARLSYKFADRFGATVDAYLADAKNGKDPSLLSTYATRAGLNEVEPKMANQESRAAWNEFYWEIPRAITSAVAVGSVFLSSGATAPFTVAMLGAGAIDLGHTLTTHDRWKEASASTAMTNLKNSPELQAQTALFVAMAAAPALKGVAKLAPGAATSKLANMKVAKALFPKAEQSAENFVKLIDKLDAPLELGSELYFGFLSAQGVVAASQVCTQGFNIECYKALLYAVLDAIAQTGQTRKALANLKASQACHVQVAKGAEASVKDADGVKKPATLGKKLKDLGDTPITAKGILDPIMNMNAKLKTQLGTLLAKASPKQLQRFKEWSEKFKQKIARKTKTEQEKAWEDAVSSCMGKKAVASIDQEIIEVGGKVIFLSDNASYLPQGGEGI